MFKKFRSLIYRNVTFLRNWWFLYKFWQRNRYWPNFKNPKTYNEKINFRKRNAKHELFSICSDKIAAKEWVAQQIGQEYIIPNFYVGDSITVEKIKEILSTQGDCLIKANHNSGPVKLLTKNSTDEEIKFVCEEINNQLKVDFGKLSDEPWYSDIAPRVLVEKKLEPEEGESIVRDYKFHVFKQGDGAFTLFVAIDFERGVNHNRSFFDHNFNYLNLSTHVPSIKTKVIKPKNYQLMTELAQKLAKPFNYVRVDLYNVQGQIFFGEMTFAPGSGFLGDFESYKKDLWMGNLWQCDPRY